MISLVNRWQILKGISIGAIVFLPLLSFVLYFAGVVGAVNSTGFSILFKLTFVFAGVPSMIGWALIARHLHRRYEWHTISHMRTLALGSFVGIAGSILAAIPSSAFPEHSWSWLWMVLIGFVASIIPSLILHRWVLGRIEKHEISAA